MTYPIGTAGQPWQAQHKRQWLEQQSVKRSYLNDVVAQLEHLDERFTTLQYGALPYDATRYPLMLIHTREWDADKPAILITGGIHGYETSGVHGALAFALDQANQYHSTFNLVIVPCVSPWGYETINRWNPDAVDPNRSFAQHGQAPEADALMDVLAQQQWQFIAHIDLHETTDSDNSEFRPALAARDGVTHDNWDIPDGFYLVDDSAHPTPEFQRAIIQQVAQITHIAPPDNNGCIIGAPLQDRGVIHYAKDPLGLCASVTDAPFVTTTEVYPDSPRTTPQNCIDAQVAAIIGGLNYLDKHVS